MDDDNPPGREESGINQVAVHPAFHWRGAFLLPAGLLCLFFAWLLIFGQYFLKQGLSMAQLWLSARDVESSLRDPSLEEADRRFLERIEGIRNFAINELGLNGGRNYKSWIKMDRSWVVMAVSASAADRFDQYLWHYPFLGPLPYQGFFSEADARVEFERLKALGEDVMMRGVGAFSTLGILPDPLLSCWQANSDQDLADLIIHELTHATIFVPGQGEFNENLASFVGHEGARQYMATLGAGDARAKDGAKDGDSPRDSGFDEARRQDDDMWTRQLHGLYLDLDQVYRATGLSRDQKLAIKKWTLDRFAANLDRHYSSFFRTQDYRKAVTQRLNNAVILLYRTYEARQDDFSKVFREQGSDIKIFLAWIKDRFAKGEKLPGMGG